MRFFSRILLYLILPIGIGWGLVKGLSYFPIVINCSIKDYTGWDCPGCGGQRAIDAIVRGEFKEAFYYNQLIYVYLSLFIYIYVLLIESYLLKNKRFIQRFGFTNVFALSFVLIILFFFIVRNI